MNKKYFVLLIAIIFITLITMEIIDETKKPKDKPLPELIKEYPITSVEKAKKDYENKVKGKVKLPKDFVKRLPFEITSSYGRIEPRGKVPKLKLSYFNEEKVFNRLDIIISPARQKLKKMNFDDINEEVIKLEDGTKAFYLKDPNANGSYSLRFQKNRWNYTFFVILNMHKGNMKSEFTKLIGTEWE